MKKIICAIVVASATPVVAEDKVPNPEVPCWLGEPTIGETSDGPVSWHTNGSARPYLITHDRDQFREGGVLSEDYNFITYWFGNPGAPIQARHYLRSDEVSLILPNMSVAEVNLDQAKQAIPAKVLCYLQTRFAKVDVLTSNGYEEVWSVGTSND